MPEKDKDEESFAALFANEDKMSVISNGDVSFTPEIPRPVLNEHARNAERADSFWCHPSYGEKKMRSDLREGPDDDVDLHCKNRDEAFEMLDEFLARSLAQGFRMVEVIHGKGKNILGPSVRGWLVKCKYVLFYSEVNNNSGSVLVRLRRFDKK